MAVCSKCGSELSAGARFCPRCGSPRSPVSDADLLSWEIEIPLLGNRFILGNVGTALLALVGLLAVVFVPVFAWANGWEGVVQALVLTAAAGAFVALVSVFTLGVFLGNRYRLRFLIADDGIQMLTLSRRSRAAHRLAILLGLLARNPGAVGAGLAGAVSEAVLVEWDEVQGVRTHPEERVVTVRRRLMPDLHVFCTPENFTQVSSYLSRKAPGGARS